MNTSLHVVKKDLIRLKFGLLLWVVVLSGGLVFTAIQSRLDGVTYLLFCAATRVLIYGLTPLTAIGLMMGMLHDDSVADVDAFWITRPISGGELLVAKSLAWA